MIGGKPIKRHIFLLLILCMMCGSWDLIFIQTDFSPLQCDRAPLTLTSRFTPRFSLEVIKSTEEGDSGAGCYIDLSNVVLGASAVPEPTTATLSLLALAGLAMRRRRS